MPLPAFPAAKVQQGDLVLFSTAIKVKILIREGFYSVETLDPRSPGDSGYQRVLNHARAKKLADYIVKGQDDQDAFLPTSVLLATDKNLEFCPENNTITIDTDAIGSFSVVDGQHRLEGLRMAAQKDNRVLEFAVPVNIAINLPKIHQMCHFLIVNTTQKSVDEAIGQRIRARLTAALDTENIPSLPKWIMNVVRRGDERKAVDLVDFLNTHCDSPWRGKIKMPTDTKPNTINQKTFVKAIEKYVLVANNPILSLRDFEKEKKILLNYWKAIADTIGGEASSILYKFNGVELFCRFSVPFFTRLQNDGKFTVDAMKKLLTDCFENLDGDSAGVGHADWWASGGKASGLNRSAIARVTHEMVRSLNKQSMTGDIEL